ncbi:MAG TPA: helix-turn-helix transcriptional regulator [Dongiaceae bacterium]|nr:helix-turn-helix transcriptional regulator [Dongiaceae bacterium]
MGGSSDIKQESVDPGYETLGVQLGKIRRSRMVGQRELAAKLDIAPSNLSRIEHGADLRLSTLLDIARALRLEPVLVPKEHLPAVRAIIGAAAAHHDEPPERGRFT